jgi:mannose-1-phosphate guanylyltransferase/phosphomannomutase
MKGILMAGGVGERLGELTRNTPKPMICIGMKPVLEYNVEQLRDAGVEEITIHVHYLPDVIRDYFGDGHRFGVGIKYHQTPELLGTSGSIKTLQDEFADHEFYVVYGDCYSNYCLQELHEAHVELKGRHPEVLGIIGLWEREDAQHAGIVSLNSEGLIDRIKEKPKPEEIFSHLVNTGHYMLEPAIWDYIAEGQESDFAKDVFPVLVKRLLLGGKQLTGWYRPYDRPELLERARQLAETGQ